jgi:hypothetical protein
MAHFFNAGAGKVSREDWVRIAHQHGVPCFNDAAADVPPISNLWNYTQMGFDLVTFSGGKGLRGPQCTGLLLGRKDLIEAAKKNNSPNSNTVGRGMKVAKEEIVGLVAAVDWFLKQDDAAGGAHCQTPQRHSNRADSDFYSRGSESRSAPAHYLRPEPNQNHGRRGHAKNPTGQAEDRAEPINRRCSCERRIARRAEYNRSRRLDVAGGRRYGGG